MLGYAEIFSQVQHRLKEIFPQYPCIYLGKRAGTLLFHALKHEKRSTVILPGFICPEISALVLQAGKIPVHIDVDPQTMHMRGNLLRDYLNHHSPADACLLIDHSFGYINPDIAQIKAEYPDLLIIEDCARAFGGSCNQTPAGSFGDWVILSMYKTVLGNEHGGIVLSRNPLPCTTDGPVACSSPREYLSTIKALRLIHAYLKRRTPPLGSEPTVQENLTCSLETGLPSTLIIRRFLKNLNQIDKKHQKQGWAWKDLYNRLKQYPHIQLIHVRPETVPSYAFLSFTMSGIPNIYLFLKKLNRSGYFLFNAWPDTPNYYLNMRATFPCGYENTRFLAQHIIHIPIIDFFTENKRLLFIQCFEQILTEL